AWSMIVPPSSPRRPVRATEGDRGPLHRGGRRPPTVAAVRARGGTPRVLGRTGPARATEPTDPAIPIDHSRTPVPPAPAAPASPRSRAGDEVEAASPARPPTPGRRTGVLPRAPGGGSARRRAEGRWEPVS